VDGLTAAGAQFFAGEEALLAAVRGRSVAGRLPVVGPAAQRLAAPPGHGPEPVEPVEAHGGHTEDAPPGAAE